MKHYFLANDQIRIRINQTGAELASLVNLQNNYEYLWNADPQVWNRHAPHLFPIVGKLKGDSYFYKGKSYKMGQHGFARDKDFEMIEQSPDKITFRLQYDHETLQVYPFKFAFYVHYKLENGKVVVVYEVKNEGEDDMFFSIGGHPGFTCPLQNNEAFDDYFLEFEVTETLDRYLVEDGNISEEKTRLMSNTHILHLDYALFENDAIVLKDVKSQRISLKSRKGPHGLTFSLEGFPYLGIWTKSEGANFICIEPWFGIADSTSSDKVLENKEGIRKLTPQEGFTCEYGFEIF